MKKLVSLVLAVILVAGLVPVARAAGYGSNGKFLAEIDPPIAGSIAISTRAQLAAIANNATTLSGTYHLTNNIDLYGTDWVPIGENWANPFTGTFDGQGYVISNLTITGARQNVGLFGYISSALISNVGLENTAIQIAYSSAEDFMYVGGICGNAYGMPGRPAIINCYNTGITSALAANIRIGGICGNAHFTDIVNCYNTSTVSEFTGSSPSTFVVGGIVGEASGTSCYIYGCYNTGSVSSNVSWGRNVTAGGIAGFGGGNIFDSYNRGSVQARTQAWSGNTFDHVLAGGISGDGGVYITRCYNAASVTAAGPAGHPCVASGGLAGRYGFGSITNSFWRTGDGPTSGIGIDGTGGTGRSGTQMTQQSTFTGYDFNNIWTFSAGENNGYPVLRPFYPILSVSLNETELFLLQGNTETLTATVFHERAANKTVNWTSSNTAVATVNTSGIVTAVAPGSATITATTADGGKTATCAVTVQAEQYAVTIAPLTNGSIAANPTTAIAGSPITLDVTPDDGYRLKAGTLKYNDIVITGNTFTMLAGDVTITAEFEPIPGADTGIDYSVDDLIVPSEENFDEIYINLTQETLILPSAYTVAAYSIDGGAKWKLVKDALSAAKFPKLFTKDLTLCLSDKALDTAKGPNKGKPLPGAQIVTFPKINKRQKAPALAVNYLVGADATGATLGDWLFVSKVKGADTTVAVKDGVQIGIADAANKNKTVDSKGFGQFYPGLTNGIPVQPIGKDAKGKDKVQKAVYFIKAAAKPADASGAYTAASKPKKVTASGQQKRPAFKVDPKKKLIKVKAGTIAQSADGTVTTYTAKGEITAPGTYDLWMAATAKKPASAKQPLTIS